MAGCIAAVFFVAGCAEVKMPTTSQILKDPLGEGSIKVGMTKDQVVSVYGEADMKRMVVSEEWNGTREEWLYKARYSSLPVNAGYLSDDLYLYFDGPSLTNISKTPMGHEENYEKDIK
jgi:hypothetical protein